MATKYRNRSMVATGAFVLTMAMTILPGCENSEPATGRSSDKPPQKSQQSETTKANEPPSPQHSVKGAAIMNIESNAFMDGQAIPERYTGEAEDVSPPLNWSNVPAGTRELALICDDPDAPTTKPWVHWVIYKISTEAEGLPEGVPAEPAPATSPGTLQGENSWPSDNIGYRGPLPPPGHGVHHYHFKLYALDTELQSEAGLDKNALIDAMKGHILAEARLLGTYQR